MKNLFSILLLLLFASMPVFTDTHPLAEEINKYLSQHPINYSDLENKIKASSMALNRQGFALYEKKKYKEAIEIFSKASKDDQTNLFAWYNLACCYALIGNAEDAVACLQKAIAYQPLYGIKLMADSDLDGIRNVNAVQQNLHSYDIQTGAITLYPDGRTMVSPLGLMSGYGYFCVLGKTVFVFCDVPKQKNPEFGEMGGFLVTSAMPLEEYKPGYTNSEKNKNIH